MIERRTHAACTRGLYIAAMCAVACGGNQPPADAASDVSDAHSVTQADASDALDVAEQDALDVAPADASEDTTVFDVRMDAGPPVDPLAGVGTVEMVREGFTFTEGPQWRPLLSVLNFSDVPANTIHQLREPSTFSVFRMPSANSNGLAEDTGHALLAAEHGNRRVSRTRPDGVVETLAERFMGQRLNSPNDVIVRSDGTVYFTDPPYGVADAARELAFVGVFRIAPDATRTLSAEWRGARDARPNGIALSPDERTLYVPDTAANRVMVFAVQTDGSLTGPRAMIATAAGPDGMAVDRAGNLFVTTAAGVEVFAPDGIRWGVIRVPRQPANCAFGGADARTLYITARTGLYRVRLAAPGIY